MASTRSGPCGRMGHLDQAICILLMITIITFDLNRFQVGSGATATDPWRPAKTAAKPQQQSEPNTQNINSIQPDTTLAANAERGVLLTLSTRHTARDAAAMGASWPASSPCHHRRDDVHPVLRILLYFTPHRAALCAQLVRAFVRARRCDANVRDAGNRFDFAAPEAGVLRSYAAAARRDALWRIALLE